MDLPMHCFLIHPITHMWSQYLQPIPTSSVHSEASLGSHPYQQHSCLGHSLGVLSTLAASYCSQVGKAHHTCTSTPNFTLTPYRGHLRSFTFFITILKQLLKRYSGFLSCLNSFAGLSFWIPSPPMACNHYAKPLHKHKIIAQFQYFLLCTPLIIILFIHTQRQHLVLTKTIFVSLRHFFCCENTFLCMFALNCCVSLFIKPGHGVRRACGGCPFFKSLMEV